MLKVRRNRSPALPEKCAIGECMALIGGAWTPEILWHLSGGARRFGELRVDIRAISPKMLSTRLKDLEAHHLVARHVRPTSPPSVEYELTELGRELLPAIEAIGKVGHKLKARRAAQAASVTAPPEMIAGAG